MEVRLSRFWSTKEFLVEHESSDSHCKYCKTIKYKHYAVEEDKKKYITASIIVELVHHLSSTKTYILFCC